MISEISVSQISFQGKTYKAQKFFEEIYESASDYAKKQAIKSQKPQKTPEFNELGMYTSVVKPKPTVRLEKKWFGFSTEDATPLPIYKGNIGGAGLSTEVGVGDTWLKSKISTPLSTSGVHDCAVLHCIDEIKNEHVLFHVFPGTSSSAIANFIRKKLSNVTKANILPGDNQKTNSTVNDILGAVEDLNSKVKPKFYHFSAQNSEVVAVNGELSCIPHDNPITFKDLSFIFVDNPPTRVV